MHEDDDKRERKALTMGADEDSQKSQANQARPTPQRRRTELSYVRMIISML